jgi:hypothetical protein
MSVNNVSYIFLYCHMNRPIALAILHFGILLCRAQTDTIFVTEKITIPCKIINVTMVSIQYTDNENSHISIDLSQIKFYSVNGTRIDGAYTRLAVPNMIKDNSPLHADVEYMKKCLRRGHQQYINGLITGAFGVMMLGAGSVMKKEDEYPGDIITTFGGFMTFIGAVVILDSHKWQKRAGLGVTTKNNGVAVSYRFK